MTDFTDTLERSFGVKGRDEEDFTETVEIVGDGERIIEPNPDLPVIDVGVIDIPQRKAAPSSKRKWVIGGVAAAAVVGGVIVWRKLSADVTSDELDTPAPEADTPTPNADTPTPNAPPPKGPVGSDGWWTKVRSLPTKDDVQGFDLATNWGSTPKKLRPLFALMEKVSRIRGSARIFALISKREADFQTTAHNTSEAEVRGSRRGYKNARDRNRPLTFGEASSEFGSGGLFGALAPYFLWTGVQEMKGNAPLLKAPPEVMFVPRIAAFGAVVYLQRLLQYYQIDDHADIKVGWASPSLLKGGRGGATYKTVRTRFYADAAKLGLDLEDTTTIPKDLSAEAWPGAATAFTSLTGITVEEAAEG